MKRDRREYNAKLYAAITADPVLREKRKAYQQEWYRKARQDPDKWARLESLRRSAQKAWRRNNPEKMRAQAERDRIRRKGQHRKIGVLRPDKLKQYGLIPAEYLAILAAQGGGCAICAGPPRHNRKWLDVDHCHTTGVVRGLLCGWCNLGIGKLQDNPSFLRRAADYLERHQLKEAA